jgi:hypothetical protein
MNLTRVISISLIVTACTLFAVVELLARRDKSRIPTLGDVSGFVMSYRAGRVPVGRIAVYGFWWWLGWHFFAR